MKPKPWVQENRRNLICVDSYQNGVLKGRLFDPYQEVLPFDSLSQFLIRTEQLLDHLQAPQSYTEVRTFSSFLEPREDQSLISRLRKGVVATFELHILFRQHSSWQGNLIWRETGLEQSFRSVLELILLMDSALRSMDISTAV